MRVIAGSLKGRQLQSPRGSQVRPTSGRLRETLFNILGHRVESAEVLDACAGSGALGLEALSRGALRAVFVDRDRQACELVTANVARCGVEGRSRVIRGSLPAAMAAPDFPELFDLILVDPPYDDLQIGAILSALGGRLRSGGTLVVERSKRRAAQHATGLTLVRTVRAGDSALDFYQPMGESPSATT